KTPEWEDAVRESQRHPSMIVGVSDGGAHLDRDDGSDWSSYFLRFWVFDRRLWTVEEGVRQMTQVPAALCGFADRGLVLPGYAADLFLFDPDTVGPGTKKQVSDFPGGEARYSARPEGVHATIANCGMCAARNTGHPTWCRQTMGVMDKPFTLNGEAAWNFAATSVFAERTVVKETQAVRIDDDVPLSSACLIGCGVLTGVGAALNRARVQQGETAAVFGVGGVGRNVIQGLRSAGASRIIGVDTAAA